MSRVPSSINKDAISKMEYVKQRTLELYDFLPQTSLEDRAQFTDVRDEIIELNYNFFGYVATHTFINNPSITYEDKLQSALLHFCESWTWYKFAKKYRTDLSFSVFYKPRIGEMIERELSEVKYSVRRSLMIKAAEQLHKHWGKVTYEDLSKINLPPNEMESLKAMFGSMYWADLETHALFIEASNTYTDISELESDMYDTIEGLLIHEMVFSESKLSDAELLKMSKMFDIPYAKLKEARPAAETVLYAILKDKQQIREEF